MESIRQVFSYRLRERRGRQTQEAFSASLGIPLRTYQKMEAGNVPQKKTLAQVVERLGLESETALFADPELSSAKLALFELVASASFDEMKAQAVLSFAKKAAAATVKRTPAGPKAMKSDESN